MKPSILSKIGAICTSIGLLIVAFKPFELDKHNASVSGVLAGAGLGFIISHFIKIKSNNS